MPILWLSDEDVQWLDEFCGAQKIRAADLLNRLEEAEALVKEYEREIGALRRLNAAVASANLELRERLHDIGL